jgi:hypothetical protein
MNIASPRWGDGVSSLRLVGYRGHDGWKDMSDFVVHFTKPSAADTSVATAVQASGGGGLHAWLAEQRAQDRSGYQPWIKILGEGRLCAGAKPLGAARSQPAIAELHRVVCFSEIPLDMLERLVERRSLYGVGFRKDVLVGKGGAPLWYLDKDGVQAQIIQREIRDRAADGVDPLDPLWRLTPFIDNPGNYPSGAYKFEWEREWRVVGDVRFDPGNVAFLFLPEDDHARARQFFVDVRVGHAGPDYLCPYIDPRWEIAQIQDALSNLPDAPVPSPAVTPWWL